MTANQKMIQNKIQEIGCESFPDNDNVKWSVLHTEFQGLFAYVEAEATPPEIGYPKFKFVLNLQEPENPTVLGCYCWESEKWDLLFGEDPINNSYPFPHKKNSTLGCLVLFLIGGIVGRLTYFQFLF